MAFTDGSTFRQVTLRDGIWRIEAKGGDTEIVDFDVAEADSEEPKVEGLPLMEATMLELWTWVPGPERNDEVEAMVVPGRTKEGRDIIGDP